MKEILTEWRKFLLKESSDDYFDIQLDPQFILTPKDEQGLINFLIEKDVNPVGKTKEEQRKYFLKIANEQIINPVKNYINFAKNSSYSIHTTEQSLQAYKKYIFEHGWVLPQAPEDQEELRRAGGLEKTSEEYKQIIRKQKNKLFSQIAPTIRKILDETKIFVTTDEDSPLDVGWANVEDKIVTINISYTFNWRNWGQSSSKKNKTIVGTLTHELSHVIDAHMSNFLSTGLYGQKTNASPLSNTFIKREEFIKNFVDSSNFVRFIKDAPWVYPGNIFDKKFEHYLTDPAEIYTRIKRLAILINPKTGIINSQLLKKFIENPRFPTQDEDVENLWKILDLSTDEKINKFVNFMNSVAKTDVPQTTQAA